MVAMIVSTAGFSGSDILVKLTREILPVSEVILLRNSVAVALTLATMAWLGQMGATRFVRHPLVLARAVIETAILVLFVYAVAAMAIADLTAIIMAAPLIVTAFAAILLGEPVGWRRWSATIAGFLGVLLIVKPGFRTLDAPVLMTIGLTVLVAVRDLVTRRVPAAVPSVIISLATVLMAWPAGLLIALGETWVWPSALHMAMLGGAAVGVTIGNLGVVMAYRDSDMSVVSPFRYTGILFALLSGLTIWGDWPDPPALFGIFMLIASGLYILHRERVRAAAALGVSEP